MSEQSDTPTTEEIVSDGIAAIKAAGLSNVAVYDATAKLVKKLTENCMRLERELAECRKDAERLNKLVAMDAVGAQAIFWNNSSRTERKKAIDAAIAKEPK